MINRAYAGFSLIELLVALVIVAILATIAVPGYREYVRRSNRAAARAVLLDNVQFLERTRTISNNYSLTADGRAMDSSQLTAAHSPKEGTPVYDIDISDLTASTYTLTATPVAGGPMDDDDCGNLIINHLGVRSMSVRSASVNSCWNR